MAVLVGGWAWAGWRNAPQLVHAQPGVFVVAIVASLLAAWWFGRRGGRASAVAVAMARAEARAAALARSQSSSAATSQVVVNVGGGAAGRQLAERQYGDLYRAEWIGEPIALVEQDTEQMSAEEMVGTYESQGEQVTS